MYAFFMSGTGGGERGPKRENHRGASNGFQEIVDCDGLVLVLLQDCGGIFSTREFHLAIKSGNVGKFSRVFFTPNFERFMSKRSSPASRAPAASGPAASVAATATRQERTLLCWMGALVFGVTIVAYLPALKAGFVWNDRDYVTSPALRSVGGLARIWFKVGATEQYYPFLHSAFWVEHRLWGDAAFGYHLLNILLHATSACLLALVLRRLFDHGAAPAGRRYPGAEWLATFVFALLHPVCAESGGLDLGAEKYAPRRFLPRRGARLSALRPATIPAALRARLGAVRAGAADQIGDRHAASCAARGRVVAPGPAGMEARRGAAAAVVTGGGGLRAVHRLGGKGGRRRQGRRLSAEPGGTIPGGRARRLLLPRQAGVARRPDFYLSPLEGEQRRGLAVPLSRGSPGVGGGGVAGAAALARTPGRDLVFRGHALSRAGLLQRLCLCLLLRRRPLAIPPQPGHHRAGRGGHRGIARTGASAERCAGPFARLSPGSWAGWARRPGENAAATTTC